MSIRSPGRIEDSPWVIIKKLGVLRQQYIFYGHCSQRRATAVAQFYLTVIPGRTFGSAWATERQTPAGVLAKPLIHCVNSEKNG